MEEVISYEKTIAAIALWPSTKIIDVCQRDHVCAGIWGPAGREGAAGSELQLVS